MPEYLAPGVYVEETSFRAKSIEGVGTSTTAFAGPTRKGPIGETPELLTSFGDFQRIYGGVDDLVLPQPINYLAHAVQAYFQNGGSRLYVSRVFLASATSSGMAVSANVVNGGDSGEQARFRARMPGDTGNGLIIPSITATPATVGSMRTARQGTLLRLGGETATDDPARITGSVIGPFAVPNASVLLLTVNGVAQQITFQGAALEAAGTAPLADPVPLDAATSTMQVTIDGVAQTIALPAADTPRADVLAAINSNIRGGYARLLPDGRLAIGSDTRGSSASVQVGANPALQLAAATATADPALNNVADLGRVTVAEIGALLTAGTIAVQASSSATGQLILTTAATGSTATLAVRTGPNSAHTLLGLPSGTPATGTIGSTLYVKRGADYLNAAGVTLNLAGLPDSAVPGGQADFIVLNLLVEDRDRNANVYEEMGFDRSHPRFVGSILQQTPTRKVDELENLYYLEIGAGVDAFELYGGLLSRASWPLTGGDDGVEPIGATYRTALDEFLKLEDISIVAAPGHSAYTEFPSIQSELITHAEQRRSYRIAVLDTQPDRTPGLARDTRSRIDSKYAALYYPWVTIANPLYRPGVDSIPREITVPPSGFVCGVYARNDVERGVFKAPANEIVRGALRFESDVSFGEQQMLNPIGVNCLRYFPGRGYRVWGARTVTSDPEWKYVNVRRYFNYLEASIDKGTQWAVFEPNGERLWANVRETIGSFLYNEWITGALMGGSPKEAYFVRCDRSTMTQNDFDNGRLICLIGVAVLKPAEFVIFRIGQKTADARD